MSLVRGKRIAIPLASNQRISGTIRLIIKPGAGEVEIHHTIETTGAPCGEKVIGVDKGYTEAFTDSEGERHGKGLGAVLSARTDANNLKYQRRNKIKAIAENHRKSNLAKCDIICKNNLGRIKLDHQKEIHKKRVETIIYTAANTIMGKAKIVAVEDLTAVIRERPAKKGVAKEKRIKGPREKRRLSGWVKGVMAEALESVSRRRGSTVRLVNCAYTSQVHSQCGCLAVRKGDSLYCEVCGVVLDSDAEAARVVLSRLNDHEIGRWTPFRRVRSILEERTSRYRLGLLNQDSSCAAGAVSAASTESESPDSYHG
jgi:transposase